MKFRKKPVVIEAVRVRDFNRCDSPSWAFENAPLWLIDGMENLTLQCAPDGIYVKTLEGTMKAELDDWIIRGVKGELYPCKPDIFEATYEPAEPVAV